MPVREIEVIHTAFRGTWEVVATVRTDAESIEAALEEAYASTQNIDDAWTRNSNVRLGTASPEGARSTSVDDHLRVEGQLYRVASFGFEKALASPAAVS